jgi:amino acid transporter
MQSTQIFSRAETPGFLRGTTVNSDAAAPVLRSEMAIVESETKLHRGTNWWGAFVIGLSGPILVTGIDPPAVESLGAAAIPLLAIACFAGVILCFCLAELAAMMPERTGGVPSYADVTYQSLGRSTARHVGGISAWAYWLGWFPVAPINMILASAYIVQLFGIPHGRSLLPVGSLGTAVSVSTLVIAVAGILVMYVPAYLGIRLGSAAATVLGVVSMVPLTLLVLLPLFRPGVAHVANVSGFHYVAGVHGSPHLVFAWLFVMTWSVMAMEAAACYIGECRNPARDAKIAMTAEGIYGFFIFVGVAVTLVLVLGTAKSVDPLTIFSTLIAKVTGSSGGWVQWAIGLPLIFALLMSVLNAIMGNARSLYQTSEDGILPRWFGHLNRHQVPDRAMGFNVVCSCVVLLFGSPLRIYVFSNMGYLLSLSLGFIGYFLHRQFRPELNRPVRLPSFMRFVALAFGIAGLFTWAYGGWYSPPVAAGVNGETLFYLGLAIIACYLPLVAWRRWRDGRMSVPETVEGAVLGTSL